MTNSEISGGQQPRRIAARAVLEAYREGRPLEELREQLPEELEATGQRSAAEIVRTFFERGHPTDFFKGDGEHY